MSKDFVPIGLNKLVKHLTGISYFISESEMDFNASGFYFDDKINISVQQRSIRAEKKVNINVDFVINSNVFLRPFAI